MPTRVTAGSTRLRAAARSSGVVIFMLRLVSLHDRHRDARPARRASPRRSRRRPSAPSAMAAASTSRRNPCGVCASQISSRGIVAATTLRRSRSTRLTVSRTGIAGTAAPCVSTPLDARDRSAPRRRTAAPHRGRARRRRPPASPPGRARPNPGAARRPRRRCTAARSAPTSAGPSATRPGGSTTTSWLDRRMRDRTPRRCAAASCGRRARGTASGIAAPSRSPRPAATMIAPDAHVRTILSRNVRRGLAISVRFQRRVDARRRCRQRRRAEDDDQRARRRRRHHRPRRVRRRIAERAVRRRPASAVRPRGRCPCGCPAYSSPSRPSRSVTSPWM